MNYRDYQEIMKDRNLKQTRLADFDLEQAGWWHRVYVKLKKFDQEYNKGRLDLSGQMKKCQEKKIEHILAAIEWAEMATADPDLYDWIDLKYRRFVDSYEEEEK